jgi:hypothetical protein
MKIMATHSSAGMREQTPHGKNSTNRSTTNPTNNHNNQTNSQISEALKRRAQSVINDKSVDAETRAIVRYGLEINDPCLPELLRRADAGETLVDNLHVPPTDEEKIETLAEMICRAGSEASAALLVLFATLENAPHPKALANAAKHHVFTRCVESNLYGMVDAQIETLESELLATNSLAD